MPALAAPQEPMAIVATGTPLGIGTIDSSASSPLSVVDAIGTPMTGSGENAATTPGSAAAPPAAAISTLRPRAAAPLAHSSVRRGVRCAEATTTSWPISSVSRTFTVSIIVSRSESLPSTMPTLTGLVTSVAPPARGRVQQGHEIALHARHDRLALGVAEAAVELDDFRTVLGEHHSGVEDALVGRALGGERRQRRLHDLAHDARLHLGVDARHRRVRTHAAGVRSPVVVEHRLVVLGRGEREHGRAAREREERRFLAHHELLDHDRGAGGAELALLHTLHDGRVGLLQRSAHDGALAGG